MGKVKPKQRHVSRDYHRRRRRWFWIALIAIFLLGFWVYWQNREAIRRVGQLLPINSEEPIGGRVVTQETLRNYSIEEVNALAKQNYGAEALPARNAITKRLVKYTSVDGTGQKIEVYARVYLPRVSDNTKVPLLSFAPGTTGMGDQCASSLEQPWVSNWANYESHMAAYAGQGYGVVITDYEGMRDSSRIHHYMVGELEGRAVLDAARAAYNLSDYKNLDSERTFVAGFSQGGQSAAWADKLSSSYAPELKIKGVVAFAPVSDVGITLADIARGANIVWYGPFVLTSYNDYYKHKFPLDKILQPKWIPNLRNDALSHCINNVKYWPSAAEVYTPEFLAALRNGTVASISPDLATDMAQNKSWSSTPTPKLINQGDKDNVILPDQQTKTQPLFCQSGSGPAKLQIYPGATHYSVMVRSYKDTLAWMAQAGIDGSMPNNCPTRGGV